MKLQCVTHGRILRIDIFRDEGLVVVTLGAFPQPAYVRPGDHDRRNEVVAFTRAVRAL